MRQRLIILLTLAITLISNVTAQQDSMPVLQGKVTDQTGNPLAGASIVVEGTFKGVQAGTDGSYRIENLSDGTYSIRFSFLGYESQLHTVELSGNMTLDVMLLEKVLMTDDVIINATRAGDNSPLAYTNISSEIIRKHNTGQDIPFLLSLTPSLIETSEAGNGIGYTSLRIRGSDASRINVTIDGIPLNDAESQQVFWVDLPDLASSVDNIQVQRGVGTSSNGAGAFGGSVNIQTKGIEYEPYAELNSSAGSYNSFKNSLSAGTGLIDDRFGFQMRFSDLRSDGFIKRTGSQHRSAFLSGVHRTEQAILKANLILGQEHTGIGWWGVPREMLETDRRYNPAGEYSDDGGTVRYYDNESDNYIQNHLQLIYSRKLTDIISMHLAIHYTRGKGYYEEYKEDRSLAGYGLPDIIAGNAVISETDVIQRKWLSNDFYGSIWSLNYNKKRLSTSIGGGINLYSGDHFGRIIWMKNPGTTEMNHQWYFNNGEKRELNFNGKVGYFLSGKISLFGDLQYRSIRYLMKGVNDDLKDLDQEHKFSFFNPKAGIFITIDTDKEAYLSFAVANREPTRADFKEASGDVESTPKPERLYDLETGYRMKTSKSSLGLNLYWMIYKDQLVPTGELSNVGYPIMTNVEKSYRAGAEFTAGFIPTSFLNWNVSLTISKNKIPDFTEYYIDYNTSDWTSEYKSMKLGKVDIAYSPSVTGSSDLAVKPFRRIDIHLISKYVGKQYFDNTMSNERKLDPYFINSLRIDFEPEIRIIKRAELQLVINNIFNTEYESNAYGGNWFEDGVEKSWSYFFPQAGTNFMIKLGLKF